MSRRALYAICGVLLVAAAPALAAQKPERGVASWYGGEFIGRKTANGEIMQANRLTAAHRTLPFGTVVDVTNKRNGRTVRVRINDRGPVPEDRIIDLSPVAAAQLGMKRRGLAPVEVKPATWE
jgi:rare lipoprotein A